MDAPGLLDPMRCPRKHLLLRAITASCEMHNSLAISHCGNMTGCISGAFSQSMAAGETGVRLQLEDRF